MADRRGGALHRQGDGAIGETRRTDAAMPVDGANNGPSATPTTSNQARTARMGQTSVGDEERIAIVRPRPS